MSFYFRFQRYIFPSNLSKKLLFFRIDTILFHLLVERRAADTQQFGGQCLVVFRGFQRLDNPCSLFLLDLQRITFLLRVAGKTKSASSIVPVVESRAALRTVLRSSRTLPGQP